MKSLIPLILLVILTTGCSVPQKVSLDNKQNTPTSLINSPTNTNNLEAEKFIEQNCEFIDNAYYTDCAIQLLDRKAAEREWKQLKIEKLTNINDSELFRPLKQEQHKIGVWRKDFEKTRDQWCNATVNFAYGSGTQSARAECMLGIELLAIHNLDSTNDLIGSYFDIKIDNFEPNKEEISNLMKTNKTTTECVWADDISCGAFK